LAGAIYTNARPYWPENNWLFGFDFPQKKMSQIYFSEIKKGIKTGLFDCVAHLDLIKQPGYPVLPARRTNQ